MFLLKMTVRLEVLIRRNFNKIMGFSKGMTLLSLIVGIATIMAGVIGIGNILLISVKERTKNLCKKGSVPLPMRYVIKLF